LSEFVYIIYIHLEKFNLKTGFLIFFLNIYRSQTDNRKCWLSPLTRLQQHLFILSFIVLFILTATYKDGRKHYWLSPLIRVSLTTFVHSVFHCAIYFDSYLQEWKKTLLIVSLDQSFLDNVCSFCLSLCYLSWQLLTSMEENITDCLPWPEFPWQRLFRYYTSRSAETLLLQRKLW
jgi:hypothetical protein